jgi:hypothetical protein
MRHAVTINAMPFDTYELTFANCLPVTMQFQLEALLFFNAGQHHLRREIAATIERYGVPEIVSTEEGLTVELKGSPDAQVLFAIQKSDGKQRPVGFILYLRDQLERLTVLHVGVAPDHVSGALYGAQRVLSRLLNQIRFRARNTAGVRSVSIAYRGTQVRLSS